MKKILFILSIISSIHFNSLASNKEKLVKSVNTQFLLDEIWNYNEQNKSFINKANKSLVIYFYANWCIPCRILSPIIDDIAQVYCNRVSIYKIDIDNNKQLANKLGITILPTLIFIPKQGTPIMYRGSEGSKKETRQILISNIDKYLLKNN